MIIYKTLITGLVVCTIVLQVVMTCISLFATFLTVGVVSFQIQRGLIIYVCFLKGATKAHVEKIGMLLDFYPFIILELKTLSTSYSVTEVSRLMLLKTEVAMLGSAVYIFTPAARFGENCFTFLAGCFLITEIITKQTERRTLKKNAFIHSSYLLVCLFFSQDGVNSKAQ